MLSAVVLSHNDEQTIEKTLLSLSFCGEIIVVDDASTDKTVTLAKKHHATVYTRSLKEDFAAQRNFGLSKAKGEWVLFVDSDEVVSSLLAQEIVAKTQVYTPDVYGYMVKRTDSIFGKELRYGETAHVRLLRLARKSAGRWVRPVHEVWDVKGEIGELTHPLVHYPHPTVAAFIEDINWYSTMNAKHFYDTGVRSNVWQVMVYPVAKFFVNYVLKLGFLDGMQGAIMAWMMSLHSFLTRAKLYMLAAQK
jgi:glycosyltransferase involved in cell wall biosynthesis